MLFQFARFETRTEESGLPIRLQEQDRTKWNRGLIHAGLLALRESQSSRRPTVFHLEARIAAEHATSRSFDETNWTSILERYDELLSLKDTPEVRTSRIVALKFVKGWQPALAELEALESALQRARTMTVPRSFLIHAVRADLLEAAGRPDEASKQWKLARDHAPTTADQAFVERKLAEFS